MCVCAISVSVLCACVCQYGFLNLGHMFQSGSCGGTAGGCCVAVSLEPLPYCRAFQLGKTATWWRCSKWPATCLKIVSGTLQCVSTCAHTRYSKHLCCVDTTVHYGGAELHVHVIGSAHFFKSHTHKLVFTVYTPTETT